MAFKTALRAASAALTVLLLAACGAQASGVGTALLPGTVVLTASNFGATVTVPAGAKLELRLEEEHPVPGASSTWQASTTDPGLLSLTSEKRDPAQAVVGKSLYTAVFTAERSGTATILAANPHTCEAMNPADCHPGAGGSIKVVIT